MQVSVKDAGLIPGSPGGRHGNPFQSFCLENPMDRRAWRATVYRVAKSQTGLKRLSMHARKQQQTFQEIKSQRKKKEIRKLMKPKASSLKRLIQLTSL